MDKLNVLVLGDGLLGSEIVKQTGWNFISRKKDEFDIFNIDSQKLADGLNEYVTKEGTEGSWSKTEIDTNKFKKLLASSLGYGYYYVRETKPGEIEVINGYRTRNAMEDSFLQTGANIDKYNQGGMTHGSYYLQMDTPQYIPKPLNPHMYTYSDVPSNLAMENVGNIPERAGIFKASMFSN
jgi:hypothetical protein